MNICKNKPKLFIDNKIYLCIDSGGQGPTWATSHCLHTAMSSCPLEETLVDTGRITLSAAELLYSHSTGKQESSTHNGTGYRTTKVDGSSISLDMITNIFCQ